MHGQGDRVEARCFEQLAQRAARHAPRDHVVGRVREYDAHVGSGKIGGELVDHGDNARQHQAGVPVQGRQWALVRQRRRHPEDIGNAWAMSATASPRGDGSASAPRGSPPVRPGSVTQRHVLHDSTFAPPAGSANPGESLVSAPGLRERPRTREPAASVHALIA
jgi:hypothetical protein